ncbi:3-phosphoinositide-dependent protein kinase 1-like [Gracilinanus agilis]|uniref:3-phosphoinositide-dependent protein kinase 1-like n=1 Tax=Gracilinanus agilis TaxID=191870 RepID=UPI001CFF2349|nr:3-phosphoinositide-dependent protein kinase 1-like [Gracilinanus agilis]
MVGRLRTAMSRRAYENSLGASPASGSPRWPEDPLIAAKLAQLLREWRPWRRRGAGGREKPPCEAALCEAGASTCTSPEAPKQPDPSAMPAETPMDRIGAGPGPHAGPGQPWEKRPEDFAFGPVLGKGSFSTVVLARELATSRDYALKILEKKHVIKQKMSRYVISERDALMRLEHPFFVKLYFTFQDGERLYFGLSYARNGDLLRFVQKAWPLVEPLVRFYTAELVCALEYLHGQEIIHRDLKPENILLTGDMHVQITDFGSAKILPRSGSEKLTRTNSFVGTAQYVSPELLLERGTCKSSDLWALGCIVYFLSSGKLPFQALSEYFVFQKIMRLAYDFPQDFFPKARDLVQKLLVLDPTSRLGCEDMGSYGALKAHPFFETVTWDDLHLQTPPLELAPAPMEIEKDFEEEDIWQSPPLAPAQPAFLQASSKVEGYTYYLDENSLELDLNFSEEERSLLLEKQAQGNPWHRFVDNRLILKMGPVNRRKGLFASTQRYQLLLTEGPCLYFVDPISKVLKGEILWSPELRPQVKSFKTFFVHTPNKIYHLVDPSRNAQNWCQKIQAVCLERYKNSPDPAFREFMFQGETKHFPPSGSRRDLQLVNSLPS